MSDELAQAVIDTSVKAFKRLAALHRGEAIKTFWVAAHPDVAAWALATKAYMEAMPEPDSCERVGRGD